MIFEIDNNMAVVLKISVSKVRMTFSRVQEVILQLLIASVIMASLFSIRQGGQFCAFFITTMIGDESAPM